MFIYSWALTRSPRHHHQSSFHMIVHTECNFDSHDKQQSKNNFKYLLFLASLFILPWACGTSPEKPPSPSTSRFLSERGGCLSLSLSHTYSPSVCLRVCVCVWVLLSHTLGNPCDCVAINRNDILVNETRPQSYERILFILADFFFLHHLSVDTWWGAHFLSSLYFWMQITLPHKSFNCLIILYPSLFLVLIL